MIVALIPSFNAGIFLRGSVLSLIDQTRIPDRIIVIDDGSTDNSMHTILDLEKEGKIEIHHNERNLGRALSMNAAFSRYEADYFILQDADDIAKPDRVARQVAFMEEHQDVACSSSFINYISANGKNIGKGKLDILDDNRLYEYLKGSNPFGLFCPAVILRSKVVKNRELQFRGEFWPADDIDLWNRIAEAGFKVRAQPEFLVEYRIHGASAVASNFMRTRMQYEWLRSCLRARRAGKSELTCEEFSLEWESASWIKKINRNRKNFAKACYRGAGFAFTEKKWIRFIWLTVVAFTLQPVYVIARISQQLLN